MTDGIIKGSGNSRYLKTVANAKALYPDYDAFLTALIAGTFPVDLYGIDPNGWQVRGDDLTKANLLTDATEQKIWGSAADRTPDDALQKLRTLISTAQDTANSRLDDYWGSWTGTGTNTKTLLLGSFIPRLIVIIGRNSRFAFLKYAKNFLVSNESLYVEDTEVTWNGFVNGRYSVSWTHGRTSSVTGNVSAIEYSFYAIG